MESLSKCKANYVPLTPLTFLKRAASAYATRTSVVYEGVRFTWIETYQRCRCLASALRSLNVLKRDVVSVLAPNVPALYEMHFGVSMAGAVLNTINCRLDAGGVATILRHAEAKVFFVDCQFVPLAKDALRLLLHDNHDDNPQLPLVVVIDDLSSPTGTRLGKLEYEQILQRQMSRRRTRSESNGLDTEDDDTLEGVDEWDPIALNYTSGTTSAPKGVVYSHRGAYVSTMSILLAWEMGTHPVYLWSLPMFHCNGWALTWGVAARGGTNICLRHITAPQIYHNIALHRVTHMCCAPVVFSILMEREGRVNNVSEQAGGAPDGPVVHILTGGAPPPHAKIQRIEAMGFQVTHAYGLTEATGVALVCEWQRAWDELPAEEQGWLKVRQGVSSLGLADVDVKDTDTMASVPRDGKTMGEIVLRGSSIMKGYFKDHDATRKVFKGGWFLTGDVGVVHPDGYVQIKDRSKDVIISGGENISSVEVENIIHRYPGVKEVAVVAIPHPRWGESPCAFVSLPSSCRHDPNKKKMKTDTAATEADLLSYCRANMPGFMVPKKVVLLNDDEELPKTSTGKIEKVKLRALAHGLVNLQDSVSLPRKKTSTAAYQHDLQIHALSRL